MKKSHTKAEREHMNNVAALPCIACWVSGVITPDVQLHHIRAGVGKGQRADHFKVLPLCYLHHIGGGHGVAFHAGKQTWQDIFGTEADLLRRVNKLLER